MVCACSWTIGEGANINMILKKDYLSCHDSYLETVDIQPLKQQASLQAHLTRKYELVDVGHRFGKVGVLATMPGNFHLKKLEWTSNAD